MVVTIDAIFSYSNKIGAKVIANGTAHLAKGYPKTSHTALLVNGRWVHESTGHSGVSVISYDKWKLIHQEVDRVSLGEIEYQIIADKFREIKSKEYDYLGVIYLGLCVIPTFIGFKLPKVNKWQNKNKYFCCEALGFLTGHCYSMSSPIQILKQLKENNKL